LKIAIIVGSIRENRVTPTVARWVEKTAMSRNEGAEYSVVDLKDFKLPLFDEPLPPQDVKQRVVSGDIKAWLDTLAAADGYVFVTPEYNHSVPSALKNALDFVDYQLSKKPAAIASHGVIGGARSNEHLRLILNSTLGVTPIPQSITLSGPVGKGEVITPEGELLENYKYLQPKLDSLLSGIEWYTKALKVAREAEVSG
jgi:NAD(P)H-dependent FMN reductase